MITEFHLIASNDIDLTVDVTKDLSNTDVLGGYDMKTKINYSTASTKGIKWLAQEKEHTIYSEEVVIAINIEFDDEYYEAWELNYATGEFGACLSSGKR